VAVVDLEGLHTFSGGFLNIRVPAEPHAAGRTAPSAPEAAVAVEEGKAGTLVEVLEGRTPAQLATEPLKAQAIPGALLMHVQVAVEEIALSPMGESSEEEGILKAKLPKPGSSMEMPR
jgi:hypothetical protein